jgi:hypothetical protein
LRRREKNETTQRKRGNVFKKKSADRKKSERLRRRNSVSGRGH